MKTLIIIANPSKTSFSHAMADTYSKKCEEFEILDLYDINQPFFKYKSVEDLYKGDVENLSIISDMQKKITTADELVFFFPIWWSDYPAILKNFFDANFGAGFAFNFLKGGKVEKLLTGKTAKIYCTCGAPSFIYSLSFFMGVGLKAYFKKAILGFCGIKLSKFKIIGNLSKLSDEKRKEILENI